MKECLKCDNLNHIAIESNSRVFSKEKNIPESNFKSPIHENRRGYKHTFEIGNFSNYNSVLKRNQDAMLHR